MWNRFDIVKAFKYVCDEREISSKPMSPIFRDYFLCGRIHFVNAITVNKVLAFKLHRLDFLDEPSAKVKLR